MSPWRPAVRMALRDLRLHRLRAVLVAALVALPILVATATSLLHHNLRYEGEREARVTMGGADALVSITRYPRTRLVYRDYQSTPEAKPARFTRSSAGRRVPVVRPRSEVSLPDLLPAHSRITPAPRNRQVTLSSGGEAWVIVLDASQPMSEGLAAVAAGRAPTASDEAAVTRPMAEELVMLNTAGDLTGRASLSLAHGRMLHVVGILRPDSDSGLAHVLVAPGSVLAGSRAPKDFLVDLPPLSSARTHDLVRKLAGQGVAMTPRDIFFHPRAWGAKTPPVSPVDPGSLAIGALVILFGLVEVVLLVGSAFAVGARRQVRDLGLLAASGGSPADVRRVVLGQGLVLGVLGSCLGAAGGIALFLLGTPLYERVTATTVWTHDIAWLSVLGLTALGSVTGLIAAFIPAWSIGGLTPLAALSGRFPVRAGESAAHRPAFVLAGTGLLVLALGGVWTAHEFAQPVRPGVGTDEFANPPSSLPVVVTGLGVLLLLAGAVWSAPYVVRRVAGLGRYLPLSGRFAFRDAARHRFRAAACAVALTATVAGAVVACFTVGAVEASVAADSSTPHHSLFVYLSTVKADRDQQVADVLATVRRVVGPGTTYLAYDADKPHAANGDAVLALRLGGGVSGDLAIVDEATLRYLTDGNPRAAATYAAGGVVTMMPHAVRGGHVNVAIFPGQRKPKNRWSLVATKVPITDAVMSGNLSTSWISPATAARLGLEAKPNGALVLTHAPVTSDQLARLGVYGIDAWSGDTQTEALKWVGLGAVGAAGLLTALVAGIAIALAAAEGRSDVATFAAVGAGPWRRRGLGAMHGVLLGLVGVLLGAGIGIPAGLALTQVNGIPGVRVPWLSLGALLVVVPVLAAGAGWVVTPTRLSLTRRGA